MNRPELIIFDLDYTLWPFWVDTHVDAPFRKESDGKVYDANNRHVEHYPDVPVILHKLKSEGYTLGIASRTSYTKEALDLVQLFGWQKYFTHWEIYPNSKTKHFKRFHEKSGTAYSKMLFFDDEQRNITEVSQLGVTCILVNGMTFSSLKQGLQRFLEKQR